MSRNPLCPGCETNALSRREFLQRSGMGFGWLAFAGLAKAETLPHFAPRAKHVIFLFMDGGVSHVDTFDPKPRLTEFHGKTLPMDHLSTERKTGAGFKSPHSRFQPSRSAM